MSRGEKVLIVNADDLGRTAGLNAGVFEAHERGLVSSASLMVGFPAAAEAARELPRHPRLGVGLHVTLTGARPLLPPERVPSLVDAQGRFPAKPEGHRGPRLEEVLAEVRAQLERFRELTGRLPTHLDSHHHSHRLPGVCEAVVTIAFEHRLPVRRASPAVAERLAQAGIPTTDAFLERFFGSEATLEVLLELLATLPPGTSELMCHPGHPDAELARESGYVAERERELAVLTDPRARAALERHGIRLAHFGELG
ncbi:MAG: ChbG/HpnK family deacetylase [Thermoanaerobaculia bacterium]